MSYSTEDERLIDDAYLKLKDACRKICNGKDDWTLVDRAFFLAKEAHQGVRRRSGEPYLLHPIAVARICVEEIGLGVKSVVASLLHDVVEDTDYTIEDIERIFGQKIAIMVDGLTKISGAINRNTSEQAEYFRKVIMTLSNDVRVILIKIADRLHNMRTLEYMPRDKQIKIASETIYLFTPLAYRLGLFPIKSELEDLCMKYSFPKEYEEISLRIRDTEVSRQEFINRFTAPIREVLDHDHIEYEIEGRIKSVYSIWSKMQRKQIPFEEVYDLFAIRIVFKPLDFPSEKTQCWQIYSSITDIYTPKQDRLRDWISMPKANGYEALHATVMGPDGIWVEVQIRTQRMQELAERGFAAHWKYKHSSFSQDDDAFDLWLKKVRDALESPTENITEFLDNFKLSLFTSEITVFTPKGDQRTMPNGATILDFAYDIHTNVGNHAIAGKINHKIEPLNATLHTGDQVEIITTENARPKPEWLEFVISTKAKQKITAFLKKEQDGNINRGIELFERELSKRNIENSGRVLRKVLPAYGCYYKDEFYSKVGAGIISLKGLDKILKSSSRSKILKFWTLWKDRPATELDPSSSTAIEQFQIASCCNPLPGDNVIGYRDETTGQIIVHKAGCRELTRLATQHGENIIEEKIRWSQHKAMSYLAFIELHAIDRMRLLLDISKVVSEDFSINMREITLRSHDGIAEGRMSLYVQDADSLNNLMDKLRRIKSIEMVKRSEEQTE